MAATVIIAGLSLWAGAFGMDDSEFWMYFNSVEDPLPLFWRFGYVPAIPGIAGYALHTLPMVWQAAAYHVISVAVCVVLWRELQKLFGPSLEGSLLAAAVMFGLFAADAALLSNLSFVQWSALLAAMVHLVRVARNATQTTWLGTVGCAIGLLGVPVGVVAVPLLFVHASRVPAQRARTWILAAIVVVIHAIQAWWYPSWDWSVLSAIAVVQFGLSGDWREMVVLLFGSLAILVALAATPLWRRIFSSEAAVLLLISVAWTVAVIVSRRVSLQGFEPRYVLLPWCGALIAIGLRVLDMREQARRLAALVFCAATLLLLAREMNASRLSLLVSTWEKYRFLGSIAEFRTQCAPHDVMVYEDEPSSFAVLCRPRSLAPGLHPLVNFVPSQGSYSESVELENRPAVSVYRALSQPGTPELRPPIDGFANQPLF